MSERGSNNSTLYFVVGALSVAVLVIGYFAMGRGSSVDAGGNTGVAAAGNAEDSGSKFSIEVDKHGGVSGAVEQE